MSAFERYASEASSGCDLVPLDVLNGGSTGYCVTSDGRERLSELAVSFGGLTKKDATLELVDAP